MIWRACFANNHLLPPLKALLQARDSCPAYTIVNNQLTFSQNCKQTPVFYLLLTFFSQKCDQTTVIFQKCKQKLPFIKKCKQTYINISWTWATCPVAASGGGKETNSATDDQRKKQKDEVGVLVLSTTPPQKLPF